MTGNLKNNLKKGGAASLPRNDRRTAHQRGYGYEWQRARLEHLQACPLCVMCKARGVVTAATVVDHVVPHRGNQSLFWDRSNWQSLCEHCHNAHKQRQERKVSIRRYHKPKMTRAQPAKDESVCEPKDGGG